ncbi:MAG: carbohydrate kinase family protein [Anaerolineae bacterium]|jgi:sugar/nucleoside kinase (ribokinase family)|nr:carbohydrate kinase family protein [Anaerolineae bacterium]
MAAEAREVVVVGNAGIDTNIYLYGMDVDWTVEANFTENIDYVGQAGGYASRCYARLGHRTAFIGSVGEDWQGRFVREELARDGIDLSALFVDPAGTARSVNIMYRDGRRKNFYDGKGHMTLQPDLGRCREAMRGARLAHFSIPNWARWLLPVARAEGIRVAVDLQDIVSPDDPYRRDFVAHADIIFFSAANYDDPSDLMRSFLAVRPGRVVVSGMGSRGAALGTDAGIRFFGPVDLPEPVVDTNGAGDALACGFLSSYVLRGLTAEESVLRGQIAARHMCARRATSAEGITRGELDAYASGLSRA